MYTSSSQASPSWTRANPSCRLIFPSRSDLISVPVSETPASKVSRMKYSKRAFRFWAMSLNSDLSTMHYTTLSWADQHEFAGRFGNEQSLGGVNRRPGLDQSESH